MPASLRNLRGVLQCTFACQPLPAQKTALHLRSVYRQALHASVSTINLDPEECHVTQLPSSKTVMILHERLTLYPQLWSGNILLVEEFWCRSPQLGASSRQGAADGLKLQKTKLQHVDLYYLRVRGSTGGVMQVVVTLVAVAGTAMALASVSGPGAVILGGGLALSSTAVAMQVLQDRGESGSRHGRATFAVLLLQVSPQFCCS